MEDCFLIFILMCLCCCLFVNCRHLDNRLSDARTLIKPTQPEPLVSTQLQEPDRQVHDSDSDIPVTLTEHSNSVLIHGIPKQDTDDFIHKKQSESDDAFTGQNSEGTDIIPHTSEIIETKDEAVEVKPDENVNNQPANERIVSNLHIDITSHATDTNSDVISAIIKSDDKEQSIVTEKIIEENETTTSQTHTQSEENEADINDDETAHVDSEENKLDDITSKDSNNDVNNFDKTTVSTTTTTTTTTTSTTTTTKSLEATQTHGTQSEPTVTTQPSKPSSETGTEHNSQGEETKQNVSSINRRNMHESEDVDPLNIFVDDIKYQRFPTPMSFTELKKTVLGKSYKKLYILEESKKKLFAHVRQLEAIYSLEGDTLYVSLLFRFIFSRKCQEIKKFKVGKHAGDTDDALFEKELKDGRTERMLFFSDRPDSYIFSMSCSDMNESPYACRDSYYITMESAHDPPNQFPWFDASNQLHSQMGLTFEDPRFMFNFVMTPCVRP